MFKTYALSTLKPILQSFLEQMLQKIAKLVEFLTLGSAKTKIFYKNFTKKFSYDEDEQQLSFNFDTPIDEDDIEDEYKLDFEVFNTDLDDAAIKDLAVQFDLESFDKKSKDNLFSLENFEGLVNAISNNSGPSANLGDQGLLELKQF